MHTARGIQGVVRVTYQEGWVDTELHQGGARVADQEGWLTQSWFMETCVSQSRVWLCWKDLLKAQPHGVGAKAVIMVGLVICGIHVWIESGVALHMLRDDVHNPAGPLPEGSSGKGRLSFSCFDARLIDGSHTSPPGALFTVLTLPY
jgi:hypothetical protein